MDNKTIALAEFLKVSLETIIDNGNNYFEQKAGREFLVLTEDEANEVAAAYIADSLWAFNAEFILDTCELINTPEIARSLRDMLKDACEGANAFVLALVGGTCGLNRFVQAAILADGRGHFLSSYDGEEVEQGEYFIYRIG